MRSLMDYVAGEIDEMIEIYQERGFSEEEAKKIIDILARHKDFFLDHMMVEVRVFSIAW